MCVECISVITPPTAPPHNPSTFLSLVPIPLIHRVHSAASWNVSWFPCLDLVPVTITAVSSECSSHAVSRRQHSQLPSLPLALTDLLLPFTWWTPSLCEGENRGACLGWAFNNCLFSAFWLVVHLCIMIAQLPGETCTPVRWCWAWIWDLLHRAECIVGGWGETTITVVLSEQAVRLPSAYVYTQRFMLFCLDDSFLVVLNLEPCTF